MQFLSIENVTKTFDGVVALKNVSFDIDQGEIHGLVGENGCGKSTLMKIIAGVLDYDTGTLKINGTTIGKYNSIEATKYGIGIIYQDLSLFHNLTVMENIYISQMLSNKKPLVFAKHFKSQVQEIISKLGVSLDPNAIIEELPIAKQQLVAIARALINKSKLIILDEPTTALTRSEINNLFKILNQLKAQGISFIFISHKLNELLEICNRVTVMRDGRLIDTVPTNGLTSNNIEHLMLGYELLFEKKRTHNHGAVLLSVRHLSKKNSFQDISFDLHQGEVLGVAGLLGAGRTELAMALFGVEPAQTGEVRLNGSLIKIKDIKSAIKNGIAYVPEDRLLQGAIMEQSIAANTTICTLDHYLSSANLLDPGKMYQSVKENLKAMQVKYDKQENPIRMLSGGNQQKVVLAKWLATKPKVLILDSPTVGIDVGAKSYIYKIVREKAQEGMAIIFISDELPELLANCDRIIMMRNGRFGKSWSTESVDNDMLLRELEGQ
ncbi:sugar ABC transporter ATP-binding protein [Cedecea colo]|uniref:Sugar ABC transporter ATP-binding protein n=1 Tax=Cedecea colo TaxID=2552946 RepID=A0ABX0VGM4_9ENTR|nr:sugar ABC transporter ATP-binding protein [Cedecea colo]NIY46279.1 sugar ABC transporter ATP-binding protein [Cedecea colo]